VVIDQGVKPGERVVVNGQLRVTPGGKVKIETAAEAQGAAGGQGGERALSFFRALHQEAGDDDRPHRLGRLSESSPTSSFP